MLPRNRQHVAHCQSALRRYTPLKGWRSPMLTGDIETVAEITEAYRSGAASPADIVARSFARISALNDPAVFISIREEKDALAEARALTANGDRNLPLFGIP